MSTPGKHTATLLIESDDDGRVELSLQFDCVPDDKQPALAHALGARACAIVTQSCQAAGPMRFSRKH